MPFKCVHCGTCCNEVTTQINITLSDIKRISEYFNVSVDELFKEYFCIAPFQNSEAVYDYEIGLKKPCSFRVNQRCSIYDARPLNCRIFPYWILADAPEDEIKNIITNRHKCVRNFKKLTLNEKNRYKQYKENIGKILLEESKITDDFIEENDFKKQIDLSDFIEYKELLKQNLNKIKLEKNKIKLCIKLNKNNYKSLTKLITKETKQNKFTTIKKLNEIEKILN